MIDVTCQCGRVCHSEEQHVGKHLRCPNCGEPVPILDAARAMVQSPTTSPRTQTNQPRARNVRRFRPLYAVVAAIGVMVLAGSFLAVHFQNRAKTMPAGPNSLPEIDEAATSQRQMTGSPSSDAGDQSTKWEIVDAEPIPPKPKSAPSSPRRSQRQPVATNEARIPQSGSPFEDVPSLPNGARIAPDVGTDGRGELSVNNGASEDAEVILYNIENDEQTRDINVKAHSYFQITGIPVGTYELKYALGLICYQFEHSVDYTENRTEEGDRVLVNYKEISVTLHPVVGGNVRTKQIPRSEFLKGHRAFKSVPLESTGRVFPR
jgi:hypothetical protein